MKQKTVFVCQSCGATFHQWAGKCSACGAWNSITEEVALPENRSGSFYNSSATNTEIINLNEVALIENDRYKTGINELDRVLGGGLVYGSVVLVGGDPGIGKSTLLLQVLSNLSAETSVLYVTGEESPKQIAMRAKRLNLKIENLKLLADTNVENILVKIQKALPKVLVIDSIQTIFTNDIQQAAGSISQIRESSLRLIRFAKRENISIFIIGHVTKDGSLAGPKILEHMVDSVLYFEGERGNKIRLIRAIKNRFGTVNELGIFAMTETGLKEVRNPSSIFLNRELITNGSIVTVIWEGTRPLLVEVQALVDESHLDHPKRVTLGLDNNRLAMLLAVLHTSAKIFTYSDDVFINVVGGVRISETAADLAIILAVISSLKQKPIDPELVAFGEIGLSGEIRPVQNGIERVKEAVKHGFKKAIIPFGNKIVDSAKMDIKIFPVKTLKEAIALL